MILCDATSKDPYPTLTPAVIQREHAFFRVILEEAEHGEQAGDVGVHCKIAVMWKPGWFVGMRYRTDGKYNGVLDVESVCGDAVPHQDACEWTMLKVDHCTSAPRPPLLSYYWLLAGAKSLHREHIWCGVWLGLKQGAK